MRIIDVAFVALALSVTPAIADDGIPKSITDIADFCGRGRVPPAVWTKCANDISKEQDEARERIQAERLQRAQTDAINDQTAAIQRQQNQMTHCVQTGNRDYTCYAY